MASAENALDTLGKARYISLITFKKNGEPARTPVWVDRMGDKLVVWTNGGSYKAKRLRRNPAVQVAVCNSSGKKILGEWFEGTGQVVEDPEFTAKVKAMLRKKYSWQMSLIEFFQRFRKGDGNPVVLELSLGKPG